MCLYVSRFGLVVHCFTFSAAIGALYIFSALTISLEVMSQLIIPPRL